MSWKGVLGIIGCYGLSDQIIHLIELDDSIEDVYVMSNEQGLRFTKKVQERGVDTNLMLINEDEDIRRGDWGLTILLWLLPERLHDVPSMLQQTHREALMKISSQVDSVLFVYGSCRSPESRLTHMMEGSPVPVTFLTDLDGDVVDDCFAAIIGGKKDYYDCITGNKDTLLVTIGYADSWRRKQEDFDIESMVKEVNGLRYMFGELGYSRVLKLDDSVGDVARYEKDVLTFARMFDLELNTRKCHLTVFEHSYALAKEKIWSGAPQGAIVPTTQLDLPGVKAAFPYQNGANRA